MNDLMPPPNDELVALSAEAKAEAAVCRQIFETLSDWRQPEPVLGLSYLAPDAELRAGSSRLAGYPPLTFAYRDQAIAIAVRLPGSAPKLGEGECHRQMREMDWKVFVATSPDDVREILLALDYAAKTGR